MLRYSLHAERALLRILNYIELEHTVLTFERRIPGRKATVRCHWLPGYMFLRFDIERDRWQQVLRAPGVIEFLGDPTPVPESVYMDLITRCTAILSLREQAEALVPVGSTVEILEGPLARRQGVVSRSSGDMVEIEMVVFNRITRVVMAPRQVMIVG